MAYPSRQRSFRRLALGLVFASVIYAGGVSAAPRAEGKFFFDPQAGPTVGDPYLTDVFFRPGESLAGPDGGPVVTKDEAASLSTRAESTALTDDQELRIEHALEAQAEGGLSGYLVDVANELVASDEGALSKTDSRADAQIRVDHAREADAQGGLSGYLENQRVPADRE